MKAHFQKTISLPEFPLWNKIRDKRSLVSFELEITACCNNNCRHCCINLPADDKQAREKEISFDDIKNIADQAVSLGAVWCLITGGEPLLRKDFCDIYLYLKKKGLLVSVFTNASLINSDHIRLFKQYSPRDIEVTVYGVTKDIYENVTRAPGSFETFIRGLNLLLKNNIKVRLKAMALRSNFKQMPQIAQFCREKTKDFFRFDPFLNLRLDGNKARNEEIKSERLTPEEIAVIEEADNERLRALKEACGDFIKPELSHGNNNHIFRCSAGEYSFAIGYDGSLRICSLLMRQDCIYEIKKGNLGKIWQDLMPRALDMRSNRKEFLNKCGRCPLINLCVWCPARAYLETGKVDEPVEYFCETAHVRAKLLPKSEKMHNV